MIFIIGGFAQGKLRYVMEKYGYTENDIFDAEKYVISDWNGESVINNAQEIVKQWINDGKDPQECACELCKSIGDTVVISQDVGCGVVPISKQMRDLREAIGRVNCIFAEHAKTVERVCCGIGMKIKG